MGRRRSVVLAGVDPSLTNTAMLRCTTTWEGVWPEVQRAPHVGFSLGKAPAVVPRVERCESNATAVVQQMQQWHVDVVYVEAYAFSRREHAHQLGEYGGILRLALMRAGFRVVEAPLSTARMLLCGQARGKGGVDIKTVVQQTWKAAGFPHWKDPDDADAMTVLNYGLSQEGGLCFGTGTNQ